MTPFVIPSPPVNGLHLGPLTIHFYALCIVAGIIVGSWWAMRRWVARGGRTETLERVLVWAVLAGIVGARLYHVITDHQLYFGPGRDPLDALKIWQGGLGIWGAIALGAVGAWWAGRRDGVRFWALADALAPAILVAQAMGRLGNWFNQELYGGPLDAFWAVRIDPAHRMPGYEDVATYHPTFLYEMGWTLAGAALLAWADRRCRLGRGKVFWLYVAWYTLGRSWIEHLRIDAANRVGGFRINEYVSWAVLAVSLAIVVWLFRTRPGREAAVQRAADDAPADVRQNGATVVARPEEDQGDPGADDHVAARADESGADAPGPERR